MLRKLLEVQSLSLRAVLLTAVLISLSFPCMAQDSAKKEAKPAKLFSSTEILDVKLSAPWQDIVRHEEYQDAYPATLEYTDENGQAVVLNLTVERRGVTRQAVCRYPPIKLRFEKGAAKGTAFRGQKSIKMVTHCEKSSRYEQYYVTEMLVYRMYNLLTDYSFRIRPLNISYVDSERNKTDKDRFAFLIEDDSDVADRHDLKKLKTPQISAKQLDPDITSIFSLFQYMIGNVDWAALKGPDPKECCHNVKLIAPDPMKQGDYIIPLPYDFDSSGIVDASYAAPPRGLPISSVTQRLYRGYCSSNPTMENARKLILENEPAIMALVENESLLNSSYRKKTSRYLARSFGVLKDRKDYEKLIIQKCRK